MSEKIFVIVRFRVKAGMEQKFRDLFQPLIVASKADAGCISYELHQAIEDSTLFMLYEAWENGALLKEHAAKPHLSAFQEGSKELLTGPPEMTLLR